MSNKLLRLVMLGAPASGKGTISKLIVQKYGCVHISPGDILRLNILHKTKLGAAVRVYMEQGLLVPDELVMQCVLARMLQTGPQKSWILDGFPRTSAQAKLLHSTTHAVDAVFNLVVPATDLVERVRNRWLHLPSGRSYNKDFNRPKVLWQDDVTGDDLVQRTDDRPEVVEQRLQIYGATTQEVFKFYKEKHIDVLHLEGNSTDAIWPHVDAYIEKKVNINIVNSQV